jgi:lipopolysaccharide/colanic/teichoic acid biosynthesis glycosyltransferase
MEAAVSVQEPLARPALSPSVNRPARRIGLAVKRLLDIVVSLAVMLVMLPVTFVVALLIYLTDRGPVFFMQKRAGPGEVEYEVYKFRSMRVNNISADEMGQVRGDNPLVTPIGRFIRRFKLDEFPQLINVVRGEMSLVGPRPTIIEQVRRYDDFERRRLLMRPGMTGWAQVNGNTELSWAERIALDVWYVDHWSLWLDLVCLAKTVQVIVQGERPNPRPLAQALEHKERLTNADGPGRRG